MEQYPVYTGTLDMLPSDTPVTPYMESTRIGDWSLKDFLRSASLDADIFLAALRLLSSYKKLEENCATSSSDQLTSSLTPPTSESNSSFIWLAEHDLKARAKIPTAAGDGCEYEDCLAKRGVSGLKKQLIVDRGMLNSIYMECKGLPPEADMRDKVMEILTKLCKFVLQPSFNVEFFSENDCLHIWTSVFEVIMDKISWNTRTSSMTDSRGRKVGCIYKRVELSNIEFNRAEIGERALAIQNRRNVRLAPCTQEVHASMGVEDPSVVMADVHGFVGLFYQVRPMGDIAIASKTASDLASLEAQAPIVQLAKELHEVEQEKAKLSRGVYGEQASSPPPVQRRFQNRVRFTPQKKRPRSKAKDD
ncbi:hypothetical protein BG006_000294 [Podila minutissima]|uniref:Uncharacterized protein n=1 Tax=Podila minutissima TaxID=64525 RepID=A0A9P5SPR6_9FUNG|nr:hypothetical protein BG006_000294 [Podila minutissima]